MRFLANEKYLRILFAFLLYRIYLFRLILHSFNVLNIFGDRRKLTRKL